MIKGLRRALRGYVFTIAGIAIGVAGIVALGAMAERIVRFIEGGDRFVLGQISVAGRGMGMGAGFTAGGLLPAAAIEAIRKVPGVAGVQPQVMLPLNPSTSQFMTLTQELVLGMDLSVPSPNRHYRTLPVQKGRFLGEGDRHRAVIGASFATSRGLAPGSRLVLEGQAYEVVGGIRDQVAGVNVQIPSELSSLLRQSTAFFSALLVGIGLLAFVIGGLSLANTVAAAVFERIRDFGVKRALGATDWQLGREILAEALAVTLSGGALGVLLAMVLGLGIDGWARRSGQQLFLFSPRLLAGALVFSVLLGAAAAAYAALRIVRLSPAEAIRRGSAA